MTKKPRKYYEPAFNLQAAKMVREQGLSIVQVSKDLGIGRTAITRWVQQYDAELAGEKTTGPGLTPEQVALLMLDIDHFKQVNDLHGHLAGDEVLKQVAHACLGMVRTNDHLARLGGAEFAVLMPQVPPEQATAMAERLRAGVAQLRCELAEGVVVLPRVSIGVAVVENGEGTLSALMRRGDEAMYAAKVQGRGRCSRCFLTVKIAPSLGSSRPWLSKD